MFNLYLVNQFKILLSAHASSLHVVFDNIDINLIIFWNHHSTLCLRAS